MSRRGRLAGQCQCCRNAFVETVEGTCNSANRSDHAESDGCDDECVFNQILAFRLFPKTNRFTLKGCPKFFHHLPSGSFNGLASCSADATRSLLCGRRPTFDSSSRCRMCSCTNLKFDKAGPKD